MRFEKLLVINISQNHTDTGRKLNVHKMFRRRPRRLICFQFTSCVYGVYIDIDNWDVKGGLSGLRQFLATESPLKRMKNAF